LVSKSYSLIVGKAGPIAQAPVDGTGRIVTSNSSAVSVRVVAAPDVHSCASAGAVVSRKDGCLTLRRIVRRRTRPRRT